VLSVCKMCVCVQAVRAKARGWGKGAEEIPCSQLIDGANGPCVNRVNNRSSVLCSWIANACNVLCGTVEKMLRGRKAQRDVEVAGRRQVVCIANQLCVNKMLLLMDGG